jgi:hypothetical protein
MARRPEERFASVRALGAALLPFANERARALWAPAFEPREANGAGVTAAHVDEAPAPSFAAGSASTEAPGVDRSGGLPTTTFGRSAVVIDASPSPPRATTRRMLAFAGAIACVAIAAAVGLQSRGGDRARAVVRTTPTAPTVNAAAAPTPTPAQAPAVHPTEPESRPAPVEVPPPAAMPVVASTSRDASVASTAIVHASAAARHHDHGASGASGHPRAGSAAASSYFIP